MLDKKILKLMEMYIEKNGVNMLTKGLPQEKHEFFQKMAGMNSM